MPKKRGEEDKSAEPRLQLETPASRLVHPKRVTSRRLRDVRVGGATVLNNAPLEVSPPPQGRDETVLPRAAPASRLRHFLNRELSWIDFDRRVLELAGDKTLPVLDRIRFCGIASSNLDEFFAVRMAELE